MIANGTTRILQGLEVLPPMDDDAARPGKAKGKSKTAKAVAAERFQTLNTFVDVALAELSRAEIAIWLVLFRDCREGIARTAQTDIARRAGCDRRTVNRAIRRLEQRGLIRVVYRGGLGCGCSRYSLRSLPRDS
jgi:CRP-like cAMP-binding protein